MPWKETTKMEQKIEFICEWRSGKYTITELCKGFGKTGHGGADRFGFKYEKYQDLVDKLFVSVCSFECDVISNSPKDLRIMGDVAKFEYDCFAEYAERFGNLPEFNNKSKIT